MKHAIILATGALTLAGCHKSPTKQFAKMCDYQKQHDPSEYAKIENMCREPQYLPDDQKMLMVNGYKALVRARTDAGVEAPR